MDKVKITLAVLRKHHFWLLCLIILSLSLLSWSKAANDMSAHYAKRKADLQAKTTKVLSIGGDAKHPNDKTIRGIQSRHGVSTDPSAPNEKNNLVDSVREVWSRLYAEQRDQNPLPKALVQKEGFQREFDKRWGPLEKLGPADEMDPKYRDTFLYHIKEHFPTLFRIIDRRQEVDQDGTPVDAANRPRSGMGGAAGGAAEAGMHWEGIVDWDDADAQRLISRFTQWRTTPSTLERHAGPGGLVGLRGPVAGHPQHEQHQPRPDEVHQTDRPPGGRRQADQGIGDRPGRGAGMGSEPAAGGLAGAGGHGRAGRRPRRTGGGRGGGRQPAGTGGRRTGRGGRKIAPGRPLRGRPGQAPGRPHATAVRRVPHDARRSPARYRAEGHPQAAGRVRQFEHADRGPGGADPGQGFGAL